MVETLENEGDKAKVLSQMTASVTDESTLSSEHFCKRNRWNSYNCTLCKVFLPSLGAYEQHAQSEFHMRAVEIEVTRKQQNSNYSNLPVVFLSIYEHNSNLLTWRETGSRIELIPMTENGDMDYEFLEQKLASYKRENCVKIGAFSAGSNITGNIFDVDRIAYLCHSNNALVFFDYATMSPYQEINLAGLNTQRQFSYDLTGKEDLCTKDAIFLAPHKLVGGPGTSGVLLATKTLLYDKTPDRVGGGPVFFVNEKDHDFVANVEELEEAGTPGIIQDIRTGLVYQLREQVGTETITRIEEQIKQRAYDRLSQIENLYLLGNNTLPKVPIFSFMIKTRYGKLLHPFFVTSLLNDLFGIQTRSGCSCAAMYGQKILGIDLTLSRRYKEALYEGNELLRMGFTRLNFNYFMSEEDIEYVLSAIEFVCKFGWMFLPSYKFDVD